MSVRFFLNSDVLHIHQVLIGSSCATEFSFSYLQQILYIIYKSHMLWGACATERFSVTLLDDNSAPFNLGLKAEIRSLAFKS